MELLFLLFFLGTTPCVIANDLKAIMSMNSLAVSEAAVEVFYKKEVASRLQQLTSDYEGVTSTSLETRQNFVSRFRSECQEVNNILWNLPTKINKCTKSSEQEAIFASSSSSTAKSQQEFPNP